MATILRKGKRDVCLLNPAEKSRKYAHELREGVKFTNDGQLKFDKNQDFIELDKQERAYRSGYLDSRKDEARLYKWKQKQNSKRR